jgi:chromosome partitioning protein
LKAFHMKVIAFAQQKGGTSKTTLAVHMAAEAVRAGLTAVVLELDKQGTASLWGERRAAPPDVLRVESHGLPQALAKFGSRGTALAVLDCPGSHSVAVTPAIKAADLVLLPARPHEVDIAASADTLASCQRLGKPYAYVLSLCPPSGSRAAEARAAFEAEGHAVAPVDIVTRAVMADAVARGRTAFELEPRGKAAEEIAALWAWLKGKLEL